MADKSISNDDTTHFKTESGRDMKIVVKYGFRYIEGNDSAYFSITSDTYESRNGAWKWVSGGCQHNEVAKHFPEIAHLIKYHLFSMTAPMHYIANARYWWRLYTGETEHSNPRTPHLVAEFLSYFKSTVAWGALPEDADFDLEPDIFRTEVIEARLTERLPALMAKFRTDVEAAGFAWNDALALSKPSE